MKTLQFIYQDAQIHFALQNKGDVMVNATEMAKLFNKRIDFFLKSDHAKNFINELLITPFGGNKTPLTMDEIIFSNKKAGTYMHRVLALKFAAWLDPKFELWVFSKLDDLVFGNYKKHWDAHALQTKAEEELLELKDKLLKEPTTEIAQQYFLTENKIKKAKATKRKAIANQLKMEF